ncbi:hypothetical protein B0H19DRAFT_1062277 [Mycena capillaripes]|nr:hypothetical protein B0H19DRAFT_1062277 [Mycena capillaripes]
MSTIVLEALNLTPAILCGVALRIRHECNGSCILAPAGPKDVEQALNPSSEPKEPSKRKAAEFEKQTKRKRTKDAEDKKPLNDITNGPPSKQRLSVHPMSIRRLGIYIYPFRRRLPKPGKPRLGGAVYRWVSALRQTSRSPPPPSLRGIHDTPVLPRLPHPQRRVDARTTQPIGHTLDTYSITYL